ncbi:hypothetical protein [Demequina sp.]|uniref:hypothetical protein n=1 Tax=Demequina sp. TaxID=2050685 RepID=UPI0025C2B628|nr:hypothetical protein [Demequina sp.]
MKAERGRRAKVVVGVIIATLALALVIAFEVERRSTVDVEVALAQPFLQLDTEAKLTKDYGAVFPDGLGTDMCAVYVTYETDDANAVVEQVKSALRSEGWDEANDAGTLWSGGPGHSHHRWARIQVSGDEVSLFIGRIEG